MNHVGTASVPYKPGDLTRAAAVLDAAAVEACLTQPGVDVLERHETTGRTALAYAAGGASEGAADVNILQSLIYAGADPGSDPPGHDGRNAWDFGGDYDDIAPWLSFGEQRHFLLRACAAGGDPNEADGAGSLPLELACKEAPHGYTHDADIVTDLVAAGADVNAADDADMTPLMLALECSETQEHARRLVSAAKDKLDLTLEDDQGRTVFDILQSNDYDGDAAFRDEMLLLLTPLCPAAAEGPAAARKAREEEAAAAKHADELAQAMSKAASEVPSFEATKRVLAEETERAAAALAGTTAEQSAMTIVFQHSPTALLGRAACVCRDWLRLAYQPHLWEELSIPYRMHREPMPAAARIVAAVAAAAPAQQSPPQIKPRSVWYLNLLAAIAASVADPATVQLRLESPTEQDVDAVAAASCFGGNGGKFGESLADQNGGSVFLEKWGRDVMTAKDIADALTLLDRGRPRRVARLWAPHCELSMELWNAMKRYVGVEAVVSTQRLDTFRDVVQEASSGQSPAVRFASLDIGGHNISEPTMSLLAAAVREGRVEELTMNGNITISTASADEFGKAVSGSKTLRTLRLLGSCSVSAAVAPAPANFGGGGGFVFGGAAAAAAAPAPANFGGGGGGVFGGGGGVFGAAAAAAPAANFAPAPDLGYNPIFRELAQSAGRSGIETLDVSQQVVSSASADIAAAMSKLPRLKDFAVRMISTTNAQAVAVASGIAKCATLEKLRWCPGLAGAQAMATAVKDHPSLTEVDASGHHGSCGMSDKGAAHFAAVIASDQNRIRTLRLGFTEAGAIAVPVWAAALRGNTVLTELDLSGNMQFPPEAAKALAAALHPDTGGNTTLRRIDLMFNAGYDKEANVAMARALAARRERVPGFECKNPGRFAED